MEGSSEPANAPRHAPHGACLPHNHTTAALLPQSPPARTMRACPPAAGGRSPSRRNAPAVFAQAHTERGTVRSPRFAAGDVSAATASCVPLSPSTPKTPPPICARPSSSSPAYPPLPPAVNCATVSPTTSAKPLSAAASPRGRERRLSEGKRGERRERGIQRLQAAQTAEGSGGPGERLSCGTDTEPSVARNVPQRSEAAATADSSLSSSSSAAAAAAVPLSAHSRQLGRRNSMTAVVPTARCPADALPLSRSEGSRPISGDMLPPQQAQQAQQSRLAQRSQQAQQSQQSQQSQQTNQSQQSLTYRTRAPASGPEPAFASPQPNRAPRPLHSAVLQPGSPLQPSSPLQLARGIDRAERRSPREGEGIGGSRFVDAPGGTCGGQERALRRAQSCVVSRTAERGGGVDRGRGTTGAVGRGGGMMARGRGRGRGGEAGRGRVGAVATDGAQSSADVPRNDSCAQACPASYRPYSPPPPSAFPPCASPSSPSPPCSSPPSPSPPCSSPPSPSPACASPPCPSPSSAPSSSPRRPNIHRRPLPLPHLEHSPQSPARPSPPAHPGATTPLQTRASPPPPPARVSPPPPATHSPPAPAPPTRQGSSAALSARRGAELGGGSGQGDGGLGSAAVPGLRQSTPARGERAGAAAATGAAAAAAGEPVIAKGHSDCGRGRADSGGACEAVGVKGAERRWQVAERSSGEDSGRRGVNGAAQSGASVVAEGRDGEGCSGEGAGRGTWDGGEGGGGSAGRRCETPQTGCEGKRGGVAIAGGMEGGGEQHGGKGEVAAAAAGACSVACAAGGGRAVLAREGWTVGGTEEGGWGGVESRGVAVSGDAVASVARLMLMQELQQLSDEEDEEDEHRDDEEGGGIGGEGEREGERAQGATGRKGRDAAEASSRAVSAAGAGGAAEGGGSQARRTRVMHRSRSVTSGPLASRASLAAHARTHSASRVSHAPGPAAAAAVPAADMLGRRVVASRATSLDTFENWPTHRTSRPTRAPAHPHRPASTSPSPHPPPASASTASSNLPATSATPSHLNATSAPPSLERQESSSAMPSNGQQVLRLRPAQNQLQGPGTVNGSMPRGRGEGGGGRGQGCVVRAVSMRERRGGGVGEGGGEEAESCRGVGRARSMVDRAWGEGRAAVDGEEPHLLLGLCRPIAELPQQSALCRPAHAHAHAHDDARADGNSHRSGVACTASSERSGGGNGVLTTQGGTAGAGLGGRHGHGHERECPSALSVQADGETEGCSHGWQQGTDMGALERVEERDGDESSAMACGACEGDSSDACACAYDDALSVAGSCSGYSQGSYPGHRSTGSRSSMLSGITVDTWGTASTTSAGGSSRSMCSEGGRVGGGGGECGEGWHGSKRGTPVGVGAGGGVGGARMSMVRALSRSVNVNLRMPSYQGTHIRRAHTDAGSQHSTAVAAASEDKALGSGSTTSMRSSSARGCSSSSYNSGRPRSSNGYMGSRRVMLMDQPFPPTSASSSSSTASSSFECDTGAAAAADSANGSSSRAGGERGMPALSLPHIRPSSFLFPSRTSRTSPAAARSPHPSHTHPSGAAPTLNASTNPTTPQQSAPKTCTRTAPGSSPASQNSSSITNSSSSTSTMTTSSNGTSSNGTSSNGASSSSSSSSASSNAPPGWRAGRRWRRVKLRLSSAHAPCRLFSPADLAAATLSFHPDRLLGQGAYGPVYQGEVDGVLVAVKRMKARAAGGGGEEKREERRGGGVVWEAEEEDGSSGVESFEREVEVLSRVKHDHIVKLVGCCPDDCSLVYEYMGGGSLQQRLEQQAGSSGSGGGGGSHASPAVPPPSPADHAPPPPLLWQRRVGIAHEIASALLYLHRSHPPMIHRDLKPANILLSACDRSKIADVGIACALANPFATSVKTHRVRGTVGFIAPEAIASFELSPRSDVYSFGILLLMLLTGFTSPRSVHDILAQAMPPGRPRDVDVAVELFTARLDGRAGRWEVGLAGRVVRVGVRCVERCAEVRPDLEEEVEPELREVARQAEEMSS
ncbi:hypothetical protein CLOM_g23222 [Closterium sp. NIES-68]|nr:hypothetical protein CLOM_g23222 [Closterium sp. NIES-68]